MMWRLFFVLLVISYVACAPVASKAATMPVALGLDDYDDIPKDRCTPELHGMFLSYQGGNAVLDAHSRERRSCERSVLHAQTAQALAEARCPACDRARAWATAGIILTVGSGLLTVGLGAVFIERFVK